MGSTGSVSFVQMQDPRTHDKGRQTILSDINVFRRHPSPQDAAELQALVVANESSVASLNEEIEACSRQLGALRAKSYAHIHTIRRCQAAMTLARLIPPELLANIFEHASDTGWTRAPIVVSHVCSTWRAAALSHPGVWSRVTVNLDMRDPVGWIEILAVHGSPGVPLHVKIRHTGSRRPVRTSHGPPVGALGAVGQPHPGSFTSLIHAKFSPHAPPVSRDCVRSISRFQRSTKTSRRPKALSGFANAFQDAPSFNFCFHRGERFPQGPPPEAHLPSCRI
jgi:hypothetical protein